MLVGTKALTPLVLMVHLTLMILFEFVLLRHILKVALGRHHWQVTLR